MGKYTAKVYVVQQADADDKPIGPVLAVKLTFGDAHGIAKAYAPARVTCIVADKTPFPNNPEHRLARHSRN
jgi:hypothetical protein